MRNHVGTLPAMRKLRKLLPATFVLLSLCALGFIPIHLPAPSEFTELRFNEGSGTTTADASGAGHNGTLVNSPTWVAGKDGQALNFNGTSSYVNIPDHADFTLTPTVSYTWSAWVKNNNFNQWGPIWSQTLSTTNFFYFYAHSSTDVEAGPVTNGVSVYWYSGSNKLVVHSNNNVLSVGTWSYITVTYDASQAQANRFTIYVNGTDVTNRSDIVSAGTIAAIDPNNIRVGSDQNYNEYINASIDEVRYYRRLLSLSEIQTDMNTSNTAPDVTAPTVSLTAPAAGNVSGTINVTANASDNVGVVGVQFQLDGANLGTEDVSSPYSVSWNTTTIANGNHTLTAKARDAAGNSTISSSVIVNVSNPDVTAPTVSITAPAAGNVSGTINITANAADNVGVVGVQFILDGTNLGSEALTSPYSVSWNTTAVANGNHTLTAKARDAAGNMTTSAQVIVNVNNTDIIAPTVNISAPAAGNVSGTISVTANASDNVGVASVQFILDGANLGSAVTTAPYSISWNTTTIANGNHTLTAVAKDAAGNSTTSAQVIVNVSNIDATAPTVNISAPGAGNVSGTISVSANASDNIGVVGVQFQLDGVNLGTEDLTSPYSISWNTTTAANGNHTLTAIARDAAGNKTTSADVIVNVNNDVTAPTVAISSPTGGNVLGTISVTASASDNVGVVGVQFLLDGNNLGTEVTSSPYTLSWNTTATSNGNHNLSAKARDAAGNTTTSSIVVVNVNNDVTAPTITVDPPTGTVTGTINVTATASDNVGVVGVQFLLDGNNLGSEDLTAPYSVSWATAGGSNGNHNITARARDAVGNTTTSAVVVFNVVNANSGLVAAFGFNENTGTVANDNSGNGNNGTLTNGPTWSASGKFGAAISFDGVDDFVNIADANSLDLTNGMTLEAWVNASNLTGYKTAICKENGTTNLAYALSPNNGATNTSNQRPNSRIRIGSNTRTVTGTSKLSLNTWTHLAITYDGTTMRLYVNGTQTSTLATTGSITATTNPLRIGGTTALGQYFTGLIDEVRVYNRALAASEIQTDMNTPIAPDAINPTITMTAPAAGNVSGTINVTANASDNIGVAGVQFLLDGNNLGTEVTSSPYSISWNTTTASNGPHTLSARARDASGNTATATSVNVNANNDLTAPTINITSPAAGTVAGTFDITVNANDNVGVVGVQFLLNGSNLGTEVLTAPYTFTWNSNTIADGSYTLTAKARDAAGNVNTSAGVAVNVLNHPPDTQSPTVSISSPAAGEILGTVNVTADASDNVGVVGVQFLLNGVNLGSEDLTAPYSISWNTLPLTNGVYTLTAKARDAAGNVSTSADVVVTVNNPPDTQSPTVTITAPAAGNVSGTLTITATANDNIAVTGVRFLLDGNPIAEQIPSPPYSLSWNTLNVTNGQHTLTATARDAAGNVGTSAAVIVTVNNDVTAPTVSITSPAPGTVSGTISVNANASDNVGVVGVQFLLDGNTLGAEDLISPYSVSWTTSTITNGVHSLTAKARDAAGNVTTSSPVSVTVNNVSNLLTAINFNEGTGTTAADLSGNNHNGTLTSSPTWVAGKYGQAVNFNGTSSYVNIADHNDYTLDPTQNYTWSAWVKNTSFKEWSTVWSQTINTSNFFYFYAHTTTDVDGGPVTNGISVYWWVNGGASKLGVHSNDNVLTLNQWSYVAVTYNASQPQNNRFTIYVNGVDVTARSDVSSAGTITTINPTNIRIGSNQAFGEYLNGAVDEVRYYNRLLTVAEIQNDMNTPIGTDNTAPAVNISAPAANSFVAGTINVTANATDNLAVAGVQFLLDGNNLGTEDVTAPYDIPWNTTTASAGSHTLSARARDAAGNATTSVGITVTVDNTAPTVSITSPTGTIAGNVDINASASDNNGVVGVQFLLNGNNLGSEVLAAPYKFTWNTLSVGDGSYTLTAKARDAAGNVTTSAPVAINVVNHAPDTEAPVVSITSPSAGEVLGTISITASASDNIGIAGVQFLLNGNNLGSELTTAPYSLSWNTYNVANGDYVLTARARDAAGNVTNSVDVAVTVNNPPDTQSPVVSITAPSAGNVAGAITVSANASDNAGVVGVQFLLNGNNLGSEDLTAPYSISWNTKTVANGTYTLTARARDAAGNNGVSADVIITVNNDLTPPVVSISSPNGGSISGTINVNATASDDVGVVGVQFLLDGANLGTEDLSSPYSVSWNTATVTNGNHVLSAKARDAAGNITFAADVNVTVANTTPIISAITATSITESSAVITWTTSIAATSQVNYGTTNAYGLSTLTDSMLVTAHFMLLTSLAPGTVYHYQVLSGNIVGNPTASGDNTFTTVGLATTLGTLNTHTVLAYPSGKIVPWTTNPTDGYSTVVTLGWNYLLNQVPNDPSTGKPAYYSRSYLDPNTQQVVDWPHNPAGLFGMLIEAACKYYGYSGNVNVMQLAENVGLWHLDHGMTLATDSWSSVPYSEGVSGSLTYGGAPQDGTGVLEPDKIGELAYSWLQLYKYDGNTRFRDAAIQAANVLAAKIRTGNVSQSPWPFRVTASNNSVVEDYCANVIGPISLFDALIAAGLGNTTAYQTARTTAWNWLMTYPIQNNNWSQYFEDVGIQGIYNHNLNQYDAMMAARYLLLHPEFDANWEAHARGLITWVENTFGDPNFGATAIKEQTPIFPYIMGSHTSRYASVNALLYEKTGDLAAKEKAYRSFNWASYMARSTGVIIDGPDVNNQWFTDGYGDYIRHFMTGMSAVPEWSPASQTHLLRTNSVIKTITYGTNTMSYQTFDGTATEIIHISYNPVTITADGVPMAHRSDLSQPGWTLDIATKTLRIYHTGATQIVINPPNSSRMITHATISNDTVAAITQTQKALAKPIIAGKLIDMVQPKPLTILPNPSSVNFALKYVAQETGKVMITITTADGKAISATKKDVVKGLNTINMQSLPSWKAGVYVVTVQQDERIQQVKWIYQR